jgi:casein kinase 1
MRAADDTRRQGAPTRRSSARDGPARRSSARDGRAAPGKTSSARRSQGRRAGDRRSDDDDGNDDDDNGDHHADQRTRRGAQDRPLRRYSDEQRYAGGSPTRDEPHAHGHRERHGRGDERAARKDRRERVSHAGRTHASSCSASRTSSREAVQVPRSVLVVGDYELRRKLGEGSFGSVFLCKHRTTGHVACAKLEEVQATAPQVRYEYELYRGLAFTAARRYIPAVYCQGHAGDYRYMVMDVGGCDLSAVTATHSAHEKLRLMSSCLDALRAIHDAGLVHRDLKPKNMLLRVGTRVQVMLVDFGLAKGFRPKGHHIANRHKSTIAGTTRYASVPCLMGTEASRRDDLYSLCYSMAAIFGHTLPWQAVRGKRDDRLQQTLDLKRTLEPRVVFRGCPAPVATIYMHVLQLGFAQRPDYDKYQAILRDYHHRT